MSMRELTLSQIFARGPFQTAQTEGTHSASQSASTSFVGASRAPSNRLKDFRRIATRYDRLGRNSVDKSRRNVVEAQTDLWGCSSIFSFRGGARDHEVEIVNVFRCLLNEQRAKLLLKSERACSR